jgi:hypothetical protein
MDCTAPGQFPAERLIAFAGGEPDQALATHLSACAACTETLAAYTSAEHAFRAVLYRADCATSVELGELALDLRRAEQTTMLRAHIAGCPYCGAEFAGLREALRTDPLLDLIPRPSPFRRLIARLLSTPAEVMAYGMPATVNHDPVRIYEAEGVRVLLTLVPEGSEGVERWTLQGAMLDSEAERVSSSSTAHLLLNGRQIADSPIDDLGHFAASGLGEGTYDLELHLPNRLIALESLPVGGEWEQPKS